MTEPRSKWRDQYKVHPAADVFPMMSDDELAKLGEDIKKTGLINVPIFYRDGPDDYLIDGRNRLEAAERIGLTLPEQQRGFLVAAVDPVTTIISLNIRRRHLTKAQQAELIVAAIKAGEKPLQVDEVSKGGRGKINGVKAKAVATAADHGISKSTVERAIAKAEGRARPEPEPPDDESEVESARRRRGLLACLQGEDLEWAKDHVAWLEQHPEEIDEDLRFAIAKTAGEWQDLAARLTECLKREAR